MLSIAFFLEKININEEKQTDFLSSLLAKDIIYSERIPTESEKMKD